MEIFNTIITGVTVFVLSELILRLFIEPIQELKKLQRQLIADMSFYANIYTNATINTPEFNAKTYEVSDLLRKNAVKIESIIHIIPCYDLCAKMKFVPAKSDVSTIKGQLIGISNLIVGDTKHKDLLTVNEWAKDIESKLNFASGSCYFKNFDLWNSLIIFILFMAGTVTVVEYLVKATEYILGVF